MSLYEAGKRAEHRLLHDPLLARIDVLHQLSVADRLNWISSVRSLLGRQRADLAARDAGEEAYSKIAIQGLLEIVDIRLRALDELYRAVLREHDVEADDAEEPLAADL